MFRLFKINIKYVNLYEKYIFWSCDKIKLYGENDNEIYLFLFE